MTNKDGFYGYIVMKWNIPLLIVTLLFPVRLFADSSGNSLAERAVKLAETSSTTPLNRDFTFLLFETRRDEGPSKFTIVQRHGRDVSMILCDGDGTPQVYARNNFAAYLDCKTPGGLVVCETANWRVVCSGGDKIYFGLVFQPPEANQTPGFYWDPASVISRELTKEVSETFEPGDDSYLVETQKSRFSLGFVPDMKEHSTIRFLSVFTQSYLLSATELNADVGATIDLADVNLDTIKHLSLSIRKTDAAGMIQDENGTLSEKDPKIIAAATAFAKVLPIRPCLAAWMLEVESQKIWLASNIARALVKDRAAQIAITAIVKSHSERLISLITDLRRGRIDVNTAFDLERANTDIAQEVKALLPPAVYPKFVRQYLTAACPCPLAGFNRTEIARAIDAIDGMNVEPAAKTAVAVECVKYDGLINAIAEDSATRRIVDAESQYARFQDARNTFFSGLQKQLGPAAAKTVIDKYLGQDGGNGI